MPIRAGPTIWPIANAAVSAAISFVGEPVAIRLASCVAAIVITMNVPPTHSAETTSDPTLDRSTGAMTPVAITTRLHAATRLGGVSLKSFETATLEAAAASPKAGHAQPKTAGSLTSALAAAGMNVAGRM